MTDQVPIAGAAAGGSRSMINGRVTFPDLVRAEWIKIGSLRSTMLALVLTVAISAGVGLLIANATSSARDDDLSPLIVAFYGLTLSQLALVVFGVLAVAGEQSTGTIRASLAAVPWRGRLYSAKALTGGAIALATAVITVAAAFLVARGVLGADRLALGSGQVQQAVVGSVLYLALICLFAMGIAAVLRSTTTALAMLLPLLFLGSQGLGNVPGLVGEVTQYLPDQAGMVVMNMVAQDDAQFARDYGPWAGLGILGLWTVAALIGGWLAFRRRDV